MNILKPLLFIVFSFFLILISKSCTDACEEMSCQNGGHCIQGACECPDGFLGINCEIQEVCLSILCQNEGICVDGSCICPTGYYGELCEIELVQHMLDTGMSPIELFNDGILIDSLYGKIYEGGLIFYLDTITGNGMVAAPIDQSFNIMWGCPELDLPGAENRPIWTGATNTENIITNCTTGDVAAKLCTNLDLNDYSDWFLPSLDELSLMYHNLDVIPENTYWSSSQMTSEMSWVISFGESTSISYGMNKEAPSGVRAARKF